MPLTAIKTTADGPCLLYNRHSCSGAHSVDSDGRHSVRDFGRAKSKAMVITTKRNLSQRIDNFLKACRRGDKRWSRWELHNLLIAISRLEAGRYSEGECTMSEVERGRPFEPDGYEWRSTADIGELERRLESAIQTDQQASHATRGEPEQCKPTL